MSETQTPETQQDTHTPGELAYQAAQQAAGFGDPYAEEAGNDAPSGSQLHDGDCKTPASPRAFYRSDYGRAARLIQAARHVPGDPYTAKPEAQQDSVGALACTLVQVFQADSDRFDAEEFIRATWLPVRPEAQSGSMPHTLSADGDPIGEYPDENEEAQEAEQDAKDA